jgi:hypothetical protein
MTKHSLPPPPPPPISPPSIRHLPSARDQAQSTYQQIEHNIYRGSNTGNSPVDDCLPCQCKYNPCKQARKERVKREGIIYIQEMKCLSLLHCSRFHSGI